MTNRSGPALDFSTFDQGVRIQDDLFRHVNGTWLREAEIDEDKPSAGAFVVLRDQAEAAVRDIITGVDGSHPGTDEAKIADLYASFMDSETIEAAGASPLGPPLRRIDAVTTPAELMRLLGGLARRSVDGLIGLGAESDPGDPSRYVMFVGQSGLGLPDEEYYRLDSYAEIRQQYVEHVSRSLTLAGVADPDQQAQQVVDLETEIAARHWDKVTCRDLRLMYNLTSLQDFKASNPGLHWREFLAGADIDEQTMAELVVEQPSFFSDVAELLIEERLPAWRSWARWKLVSSFSPYLSGAFVDERFHFYGTVLSGTPVLRERWKRGVGLVEGVLGEAVGKVYVERHFSPTAKARMDALVQNLVEAYRVSISELDWMTEKTKARALDKLAKFRPHIGYPSKWRDYSSLEIRSDDLLGNVMRAASFEFNRSLTKIGQPVDRDEWLMTPQTVNAYYHPLKNEIVFPAAILQPPFFSEDADDAVNYGGIGSVIGHEIGHGFDDQGSTCDGDGKLENWWTDLDRAAFEERTRALIHQYDTLEPAQTPGHRVNGELTIGENIGDLGGLTIAYRAYELASSGQEVAPLDGYSDLQRLFLSWATIWRAKSRTEMVLQRLSTDPHSPPEFRCNQIVRNLPAFYDAFDVADSDALWLEPDKRVKIW
ncbi:MAG TPA: M13-type metalloendopeptidase [Propionibacteriaceae bacterium]|nr:M13-type metalloendopeptidase [Propionibacteriaceae bacterium]